MNKWLVIGVKEKKLDRSILKEDPLVSFTLRLMKKEEETVSTITIEEQEMELLSGYFQEENPDSIAGMGFRSPEMDAFSAFERLLEEIREGMAEAFITKESGAERARKIWAGAQ
jgi:hypothetical protein